MCRPVQRQLLADGLKTAHVAPVHAKDIVTKPCQLCKFDLTSMTPQEADFTADFTLQVTLVLPRPCVHCPKRGSSGNVHVMQRSQLVLQLGQAVGNHAVPQRRHT